jgi:pyruvate/2-oxoglutarate dehydrogenase complex dihydrolipoamide acyltransferase (E2) component
MEFVMPKLGHLMEEATIVKWFISEGNKVEKGEIILQVETDKSVLDIESDKSEIITKIYHQDGDVVPVLEKIADIS